jgi:hypothetical protein
VSVFDFSPGGIVISVGRKSAAIKLFFDAIGDERPDIAIRNNRAAFTREIFAYTPTKLLDQA